MQQSFPHVVAAVLMPNHLHLILWDNEQGINPLEARFILRRLLPGNRWEPLPVPQPIADLAKLRMQLRYVHLNPCRASLCTDPISWAWSTHLDYIGVISRPWPQIDENLKRMGFAPRYEGRKKFHSFVSGDVTTSLGGTSLPETPAQGEVVNMKVLVRAMALVMRTPVAKFYRKGRMRAQAMRLLSDEFHVPLVRVAREFGVASSSVMGAPWASTSLAVPAILQVLHDPRLRHLLQDLDRPEHKKT